MPDKTELKKMRLRYGGKCAECGEWVKRDEEGYYGEGRVYHEKCVVNAVGPEADRFEDAVLDRLADLADRCKRIEDKLVSLCVPPITTVEEAMGAKK